MRIRELFAAHAGGAWRTGSPPAPSPSIPAKGRCERCCGSGFEKIEMQFLSDVFVRCPECEGKRYQAHILDAEAGGKIDRTTCSS